MDAQSQSPPVKFRNSRQRDKEKSSIYSRYLKPNLFRFKNRTQSADTGAVNCSKNQNVNDKNASTSMSGYKSYSYADKVKELLKRDPISPKTYRLINQHSGNQKQRNEKFSPSTFEIKINKTEGRHQFM